MDLIVRGICCLRTGVEGTNDNISVRSIVGNFLEHARIFYFENGGNPELYMGSADWMPRNLERRVEILFPVLNPELKRKGMAYSGCADERYSESAAVKAGWNL